MSMCPHNGHNWSVLDVHCTVLRMCGTLGVEGSGRSYLRDFPT